MFSFVRSLLTNVTEGAKACGAGQDGRSTGAEVRDILEQAVRPGGRPRLGTLLADIGREAGGVDFEGQRGTAPTDPMSFE